MDADEPQKPGLFGSLSNSLSGAMSEIANNLIGATPQSLADHPGMLPATAKILQDEGFTVADNSGIVALQHQKFIIDVTPDNGTDPMIRAEVTCWVAWLDRPTTGDTVAAGYEPGTQNVAILLAGNPVWDWRLAATLKQSSDAATRAALLNAPPGSQPPETPDDGPVWTPPRT